MKTYSEEATCPYCGYEVKNTIERAEFNGDGDQQEFICEQCDKDFVVTMNLHVIFTAEEKP
jgi:transposase-like protein